MLHILFLILKIIGILLLFILGLILFLLAVVLFVPVRYQVSADKAEQVRAEGRVSWIFGLIQIQGNYDGKQSGFDLFLFGKSLLHRQPKRKKTDQRQKKRKTDKPKKKVTEQSQEKQNVVTDPKLPDKAEQPEVTEQMKKPEQAEKSEQEENVTVTVQDIEKTPVKKQNVKEKAQKRYHEIRQKIAGFKKTGKRLTDRIKRIKTTVQRYLDFWHLEATQSAKKHVWKETRYLLRHILPRKIEGRITIGVEDPATTGQILGILYVMSAFAGNCLEINGDFEKAIFQGEFRLKGHVRICHIAKSAVSLLTDKKIRQTVQSFRKMAA